VKGISPGEDLGADGGAARPEPEEAIELGGESGPFGHVSSRADGGAQQYRPRLTSGRFGIDAEEA
jgi:hypothetical protein